MLKYTARMFVLMTALPCATYAQTHGAAPASGDSRQSLEKQVEQLREMVAQLTSRVAMLEAEQRKAGVPGPSSPAGPTVRNTQAFVQTEQAEEGISAADVSGNVSRPVANVQTADSSAVVSQQAEGVQPAIAPEHRAMNFLAGTTINLTLDGYYGYNFNSPVGRVNLLRAYDVSSNSFSLNQAALILDHAPDPDAGRRFGARVDLQYGQATETLQGSAVN
ncbi:MAG: outer membrane beta-barrel protein, partial [Acidobacteriota bacterium]|nr:outer membrane beta-barrel protein [Acidobacteriota bacterium]